MVFHYRRSYRDAIQLVIFDWAGTTVDFGCQAPVAAFVEGFTKQGVEISMEDARIPMGMDKRDHIAAVAALDEVSRKWQKVFNKKIDDRDIDHLFEVFSALLLESIEAKSDLIPGVLETVEALRLNGIKIGASTGYFTEAANIVKRNGARAGYTPDFSICASDVPNGRPYPWMIYRIMEALKVYPAEAVINVGDTPVDIESGLNAGVWSIGVAETGSQMGLREEELVALAPDEHRAHLEKAKKSLLQAGAHRVINRLDELPATVNELNRLLAAGKKP